MSTLDLYDDDFPHGSPAGFLRGCHSDAGCDNFGSDEFLTCRAAQIARNGDYSLSKLPHEQPIRRDQVHVVSASKTAKPAPHGEKAHTGSALYAPISAPKPKPTISPPQPVDAARPAGKPKRLRTGIAFDDPEFPHGEVAGFNRGCTDVEACPREAGETCRDAKRKYEKDYYHRTHPKATAEAQPSPAELTAATPADQVKGIEDAIDDLTQARTDLLAAKDLLKELSAAHEVVVLERDNLAVELAAVRATNSSLALAVHDLEVEVEKADRADDVAVPLAERLTTGDEPSTDVSAPPRCDGRATHNPFGQPNAQLCHDHRPAGQLNR